MCKLSVGHDLCLRNICYDWHKLKIRKWEVAAKMFIRKPKHDIGGDKKFIMHNVINLHLKPKLFCYRTGLSCIFVINI